MQFKTHFTTPALYIFAIKRQRESQTEVRVINSNEILLLLELCACHMKTFGYHL